MRASIPGTALTSAFPIRNNRDVSLRLFSLSLAARILHRSAAVAGLTVANYQTPERRRDLSHIFECRRDGRMLITPLEAGQLISLVRSTSKLGGCMAEFGVSRGGSARLIADSDPSRPLHLFDTFAGLPAPGDGDADRRFGDFKAGQFACPLDEVLEYLGGRENLHFHQGLFPASTAGLEQLRFSFVHVDVDLYESSSAALEFFWPRMLPGGVLLSHDYLTCTGPRRAIAEFFSNRAEVVIELPGDQAAIARLNP
jgi:O-methyltransferase